MRARKPTSKLLESQTTALINHIATALSTKGSHVESDPKSYHKAVTLANGPHWQAAIEEEMKSLGNNNTWTLAELPPGRHALRGKWVYKTKTDANGMPCRYKARWVVKGFMQKEGIDFTETFALVVKSSTYCLVFALVALMDYEMDQVDIVTAFLHGKLKEELYMVQPEGFKTGGSDKVCQLQKTLYGLKQSPRKWYEALAGVLKKAGFEPLSSDNCVFKSVEPFAIILVYVNDMQVIAENRTIVAWAKQQLANHFEIKDLGPASHFLGVKITRNREKRSIELNQHALA